MEETVEKNIELSEEFLIEPFSTSSREGSYLLTQADTRFEINEGIYQLIKLLKKTSDLKELASEYSVLRNREYKPEQIKWLIKRFILPLGIIKGTIRKDSSSKKEDPQGINQYIYLKFNVLKINTIRPVAQRLAFLFDKRVFSLLLAAIALLHALFFTYYGFPSMDLHSIHLSSLIIIFVVYISSAVFHEFGHATACYKYGANLGNIGMGIYIYFPVFYADVTDAWKLRRSQRLVVDLGGLYFQLLYSVVLMMVYVFTRSEIALYLIYIIVVATFFNLNPIFRYDGYWIFSDLIGVPNLRKRSIQLFRYLFSFLRGKKPHVEPYLFNLKTREKIIGIFYALLSNLFFVYFFYRIPMALAGLAKRYSTILKEAAALIQEGITNGAWEPVYFGIMKILPPSLIIFMMSFFLFRLLKSFLLIPIKNKLTKKVNTQVLFASS